MPAAQVHEQREGWNVREPAAAHHAAERSHAAVRRADDANEPYPASRAHRTHHAHDPYDTERGKYERNCRQPVLTQVGNLARRDDELDQELQNKERPDHDVERLEHRR